MIFQNQLPFRFLGTAPKIEHIGQTEIKFGSEIDTCYWHVQCIVYVLPDQYFSKFEKETSLIITSGF